MAKLTEISTEMAQKLVQEVGFEDRIIGINMGGSTGNSEITIYGLKELEIFLHSDSYEDLSKRGPGKMCYMNPDELLRWIGTVYRDQELADAMAADMSEVDSNIDKLEAAAILLRERLQQCDEVLNRKK